MVVWTWITIVVMCIKLLQVAFSMTLCVKVNSESEADHHRRASRGGHRSESVSYEIFSLFLNMVVNSISDYPVHLKS